MLDSINYRLDLLDAKIDHQKRELAREISRNTDDLVNGESVPSHKLRKVVDSYCHSSMEEMQSKMLSLQERVNEIERYSIFCRTSTISAGPAYLKVFRQENLLIFNVGLRMSWGMLWLN